MNIFCIRRWSRPNGSPRKNLRFSCKVPEDLRSESSGICCLETKYSKFFSHRLHWSFIFFVTLIHVLLTPDFITRINHLRWFWQLWVVMLNSFQHLIRTWNKFRLTSVAFRLTAATFKLTNRAFKIVIFLNYFKKPFALISLWMATMFCGISASNSQFTSNPL